MFSIDYCPTENMAADILTKPLQRVLAGKVQNPNLDYTTLKLIEHVTEGECWHQDFRGVMRDFCHNSMKASITATVNAIIEFSASN